jgi:hypothetical protein
MGFDELRRVGFFLRKRALNDLQQPLALGGGEILRPRALQAEFAEDAVGAEEQQRLLNQRPQAEGLA